MDGQNGSRKTIVSDSGLRGCIRLWAARVYQTLGCAGKWLQKKASENCINGGFIHYLPEILYRNTAGLVILNVNGPAFCLPLYSREALCAECRHFCSSQSPLVYRYGKPFQTPERYR